MLIYLIMKATTIVKSLRTANMRSGFRKTCMDSVDYLLDLLIPLTFNVFISVPRLSEIAGSVVLPI